MAEAADDDAARAAAAEPPAAVAAPAADAAAASAGDEAAELAALDLADDAAAGGDAAGASAAAKAEAAARRDAAIVKQIEFYFSDENLPTDEFMLGKIRGNKNGWGACPKPQRRAAATKLLRTAVPRAAPRPAPLFHAPRRPNTPSVPLAPPSATHRSLFTGVSADSPASVIRPRSVSAHHRSL